MVAFSFLTHKRREKISSFQLSSLLSLTERKRFTAKKIALHEIMAKGRDKATMDGKLLRGIKNVCVIFIETAV